MKISISVILVYLLWVSGAAAQPAHPIRFQATTLTNGAIHEIQRQTARPGFWEAFSYRGTTYAILQFEHIPSDRERAGLKAQGLAFLQYLPEYAFLVAMPAGQRPQEFPCRAAIPLLGHFKIAQSCAALLNQSPDSSYSIAVRPMPGLDARSVAADFSGQFKISRKTQAGFEVIVSKRELSALAAHPGVLALEAAPGTPVPEGMRSGGIMGGGIVHQVEGLPYAGQGVVIGIADDGAVHHPDMKNRIFSDLSNDFGTNHGEMTTTIAAGAGNLCPEAQGMAPAAQIHLTFIQDYLQHYAAVQNLEAYNVTITSTSYGDACGGIYNSQAAFLDQQVHEHPALIHCFSAGNDGQGTCSQVYGAIAAGGPRAFANLTGGRKVSKNALTVANVSTDGVLVSSSSVGPAEDGRLKPDISAVGQNAKAGGPGAEYIQGSGTSAAAPAVAGILARLTEAYRDLHAGANPPTALLKGALLNSARDMGRAGPDFEHGWGLADAARALDLLLNGQHFSAKLNQGTVATFSLQVPAGLHRVKVMAVWHDAAGSPIAQKALVNDLDLSVTGPEGQQYRPLVLSAAPHPDSLTALAKPGVDRLNNVEQVVLHTPAAGTYTIELSGHLVPMGPQPAFIVYELEAAELAIRYPDETAVFAPATLAQVVWDPGTASGPFTLDYRKAEANEWITAAEGVAEGAWLTGWAIPAGLHGAYQLRIRDAESEAVALSPLFTVMEAPHFSIEPAGYESALMQWAPVAGAVGYDIYKLGGQYMEIIGSATGPPFEINVEQGTGHWYSIRARSPALHGPRARAQFYRHNACVNEAYLHLSFDSYPEEISWTLDDEAGQLQATGGPYPAAVAGSDIEVPMCLPDGCFTLRVKDEGQDGMCCEHGDGSYELYNGQGHLLATGSHFGGNAAIQFCVESNQPALQAFATAAPSVSCHGAADGWAAAYPSGGTGAYTFAWSNGATTQEIEGLAAGAYEVTITDQASSVAAVVEIHEPGPLSAVIATEGVGCGQAANGGATAMVSGGTPPYQFIWSTGAMTQALEQIPVGSYAVTVHDSKGCVTSSVAQVISISPITLQLSADNPTCHEAQDGAAFATVFGGYPPYSYAWSNGSGLPTLTEVEAGVYHLTVTDVLGCSATGSIELEAPAPLQTNLLYDEAEGWMEAEVSGGVPPYAYAWGNGETGPVQLIEEAGAYELTVTDANGCQLALQDQVAVQSSGHCLPTVSSNTYNWIEGLVLDTAAFWTGQGASPYAFVASPAEWNLQAGYTYPATLYAGFLADPLPVYWRVWMDLNEDGDFDDEAELLFHSGQQLADSLAFQLQIPEWVAPGQKLLRISQAFLAPPSPCGATLYGETEDYEVEIAPPLAHCASGGESTTQEWIESVQIGSWANVSGNNGGYAAFLNTPVVATPGSSVPVTLTPGFAGAPLPEFWSVWADFNRDGIYNHTVELQLHSSPANTPVAGLIEIPVGLAPGPLNIRVQMRWNALLNPCGVFPWGEVEDYRIWVEEPAAGLYRGRASAAVLHTIDRNARLSAADWAVWPVPVEEELNIKLGLDEPGAVQIQLTDALGRPVWQDQRNGRVGLQHWVLPLPKLPAGQYSLSLRTPDGFRAKALIVKGYN